MENKSDNTEKTPLSFEKALEKLEETVSKMESGKIPLDEMMKYFETGTKLSAYCEMKLKELEKKIEILVNGAKSGEPKWAPFDETSTINQASSKSSSENSQSSKGKSSSSDEELPF